MVINRLIPYYIEAVHPGYALLRNLDGMVVFNRFLFPYGSSGFGFSFNEGIRNFQSLFTRRGLNAHISFNLYDRKDITSVNPYKGWGVTTTYDFGYIGFSHGMAGMSYNSVIIPNAALFDSYGVVLYAKPTFGITSYTSYTFMH